MRAIWKKKQSEALGEGERGQAQVERQRERDRRRAALGALFSVSYPRPLSRHAVLTTELSAYWAKQPDLRLGQILANLTRTVARDPKDQLDVLGNIEDEALIRIFRHAQRMPLSAAVHEFLKHPQDSTQNSRASTDPHLDAVLNLAPRVRESHAEIPEPPGPFTRGYDTAIRDVVAALAEPVHRTPTDRSET